MTEEAIKIGAYLRTLRLEENDSLEEIAAGVTNGTTLLLVILIYFVTV